MSSSLPPMRVGERQSPRPPAQLTTLDENCADQRIAWIDLLKIDTQGYELEVLWGAAGLIAGAQIRLVFLEVIFSEMCEGPPPFDVLFRLLVDRGFRLVALYNSHSSAEPSSAASCCDAPFARA